MFDAYPDAILEGIHRINELMGADRFMRQLALDVKAFEAESARLADQGKSPLYAAVDGRLAAIIAVAEIGAPSVTDRVTERKSLKRTRAVTVRPDLDFARSRAPILSARCRRVGRKTASLAGFLPSADCAPADPARRLVSI